MKKILIAATAAIALASAFAPAAEAKSWKHHGGGFLAAGLIGSALIGSAIVANRAYAAPVASDCYTVRERVWDDYRGRFVTVRRTECE